MNDDDRSERSDRLKKRLDKKGKEDKSKKGETEKSEGSSVKDRPSVLMYIPEELHRELDITFDELNLKSKKQNGEKLQKNKDFYPAVIKAGLEGKNVEDVLDV